MSLKIKSTFTKRESLLCPFVLLSFRLLKNNSMKHKSIKYACLALALLLAGCNDWLDVNPKSQIKQEALFESESGFRDALTGIYTIMGRTGSYGGNQTMGFLDMVAQVYTEVAASYVDIPKYDYTSAQAEKCIDSIWRTNYNAIANCNYILANIEERKGIFSTGVYEAIKAETIALRAFLHFDLLRGFAPSYLVGAEQIAIPYVVEVTNEPVAQSTVKQIIDKVISETEAARQLIREVDPIGPAFDTYTEKGYNTEDYIQGDGFWLYRKSRLNYYGMTALLARVYLYKGDKTKALECAREVIESGKFTLLEAKQLQGKETWGYLCSENEYISSLYVYNMEKGRSDVYFGDESKIKCYIADTRRSSVFGTPGVDIDWRNQNMFVLKTGDSKQYVGKYRGVNRIPLLKLSEMYLIAAEASGDKAYLQTLRDHRGYENYPLADNCDLAAEIEAEYQKEFIAEGQLFYYYKRLNYTTLPNMGDAMTGNYVFPMPDDEIEFGNIK